MLSPPSSRNKNRHDAIDDGDTTAGRGSRLFKRSAHLFGTRGARPDDAKVTTWEEIDKPDVTVAVTQGASEMSSSVPT